MPDHEEHGALASTSVAGHLFRGAVGFGLIGAGLALSQTVGPTALLLTPLGMIALRGCPMCWVAGLIQTISAGRLQRTCADSGCELRRPRAQPRKANSGQRPGTPFSSCRPRSSNANGPPTTVPYTVPETSTSPGSASAPTREAM